jgi:hypothetical protein
MHLPAEFFVGGRFDDACHQHQGAAKRIVGTRHNVAEFSRTYGWTDIQ